MQAPRAEEIWLLLILNLGTRCGGWSASRPGRSLPRQGTTGTLWIGDWVGLRAGLDTESFMYVG
jgi:hypothetical protein